MLQAGFGTPSSIDVSLIVGFGINNNNTQPTTVWDQTQVSIWLSILLTDGHLFLFFIGCQLSVIGQRPRVVETQKAATTGY